jgi:uncharacterized protein YecT (DUF1311 family)
MHPSATVELQGCVEQAILQSDRTINRKVATIFRLIVRKDDRASFVAGERAWLRYRRLSCTAAGSAFTGGTERPVAELQCERRLNARHITDLTDLERTLRRR